jgi:phosphoglycolate phosphatase
LPWAILISHFLVRRAQMSNNFKLVLFDFDYTLADSSKGVVACINYALEKMGRAIGISLENTFIRLCKENDEKQTTEFSQLFIKHADKIMTNSTKIYSKVAETIKTLKNKELKLGIVSGKFRYRIEEILNKAGLLKTFDIIIGGEDVIFQKPNPEGVILAVKHFNINLKDILYVGDSITDAETAKNAGVTFVATLTGVTHKEEFAKYNVYEYINEISELLDILDSNVKKAL